jgi:hypothetical protein
MGVNVFKPRLRVRLAGASCDDCHISGTAIIQLPRDNARGM